MNFVDNHSTIITESNDEENMKDQRKTTSVTSSIEILYLDLNTVQCFEYRIGMTAKCVKNMNL